MKVLGLDACRGKWLAQVRKSGLEWISNARQQHQQESLISNFQGLRLAAGDLAERHDVGLGRVACLVHGFQLLGQGFLNAREQMRVAVERDLDGRVAEASLDQLRVRSGGDAE